MHLFWGMILGGIGLGFFTYGKKQRAVVPLLVGIGLFLVPYLISNIMGLLVVGGVLAVIPYFLKI